MLKLLEMQNFKKHEHVRIEFTPGVNIICGPNYTGKSSLLQAVLFAMWGVSAVPGGAKMAYKKGSKSTIVSLEFELLNKTVGVTRTKSTAILYEDGEEVARGHDPVNNRMAELIGVSKADFLKIKYSRQKETAALLAFGATGLNELIERVSGAEAIKAILSDLKDVTSTQKGVLTALDEVDLKPIKAEINRLATEIESHTDYIAAEEETQRAATEAANAADTALQTAAVENNKRQADATTRTLLQNRSIGLINALGDLRAQLEMLPGASQEDMYELERKKNKLEGLLVLRKGAMKAADDAADNVDRVRREKDTVEQEMEAAVGNLPQLLKEMEELEPQKQMLSEHTAALSVAQSSITRLETSLREATCPTCGRAFDDHYSVESIEEELAGLKAESSRLSNLMKLAAEADLRVSLLSRTEAKLSEGIRRSKEALPEMENILAGYESGLADAQERVSSITLQLRELGLSEKTDEELGREIDLMWERLERMRASQSRRDSVLGAIEQSELSLRSNREELEELPEALPIVDLSDMEKDVRELADACRSSSEKLTQLRDRLKECNHTSNHLQLAYHNGVGVNKQIAEAEKRLATAQRLHKFLNDNRDKFLSNVWDNLLASASSLAADITGGDISELKRSGDVFTYLEDGEEMLMAGASGAQESILGLALKTSLAMSLPDSLSCLLLDEVTADMDEGRAATATALLGSLSPQVISISHREMDRSGDYNLIQL